MNNMERNRQIVQESLDKKANKRKKAIMDAEQEVITINMFKIVNANADCAEAKRQEERNKMITCKVNLRNSKRSAKRIAAIKKRRNTAWVNAIVSTLALVAPIVFCALGKTELLNMIATVAPITFCLVFNLYIVLKTQMKLKKETK